KQAKNIPGSSPSLAGIPYMQEAEAGADKLGQPVLKSDGSLLLPGTRVPLPARVVATFKESAALIVLAEDTTQEGNRPPMVFLLSNEKRMLLGREEGMDIELADPVVSRRHAEIFPDQAGFYIRDLGSSNGVLVNQTKIDNPYRLSHGDHVSLGGCMLYFVDLRTMAETTVRAPLPPGSEKTGTSRRPVANASRSMQQGVQAREKTEKRPQGASPPAIQREREPITRRQIAQQDSSKSASLPQLVVCSKCGGVNTRIARFCASCSAPLGSMV
ncbi:MAG TPA: FHA domain-containing protein, partial [Ktedonobacteraceae bacterium]